MKNRLFIAIDPSKNITSYLREVQGRMSHSNLRLPSSFHLTLSFLGDRPIEDTIDRLSGITFSRFELTLDRIGAFPSKKRPRVVWVGLHDESRLNRLQKEIAQRLDAESRFHPHITIARVRGKLPHDIFQITVENMNFPVESFILYNSTLTPQGPIYKNIKEFSASQS